MTKLTGQCGGHPRPLHLPLGHANRRPASVVRTGSHISATAGLLQTRQAGSVLGAPFLLVLIRPRELPIPPGVASGSSAYSAPYDPPPSSTGASPSAVAATSPYPPGASRLPPSLPNPPPVASSGGSWGRRLRSSLIRHSFRCRAATRVCPRSSSIHAARQVSALQAAPLSPVTTSVFGYDETRAVGGAGLPCGTGVSPVRLLVRARLRLERVRRARLALRHRRCARALGRRHRWPTAP